MMKKLRFVTVMVSVLLFICMVGCTNPANDGNAPSSQDEFTGDYTYEPQKLLEKELGTPHSMTALYISSMSYMHQFYAAAGKGEEAFVAANAALGSNSPMKNFYYPSRDYFLTVYDLIRDHYLFLPKGNNYFTLGEIKIETPYTALQTSLNGSTNLSCLYFSTKNRTTVPKGEPDAIVRGDNYAVHFWEHLNDTDNRTYYSGYVVRDGEQVAMIELLLSGDRSISEDVLIYFEKFKLMTFEEAMLAAPLPETE